MFYVGYVVSDASPIHLSFYYFLVINLGFCVLVSKNTENIIGNKAFVVNNVLSVVTH